ncbi:hypothetical protein pb186bvf_019075 [Paramecium bursaria]
MQLLYDTSIWYMVIDLIQPIIKEIYEYMSTCWSLQQNYSSLMCLNLLGTFGAYFSIFLLSSTLNNYFNFHRVENFYLQQVIFQRNNFSTYFSQLQQKHANNPFMIIILKLFIINVHDPPIIISSHQFILFFIIILICLFQYSFSQCLTYTGQSDLQCPDQHMIWLFAFITPKCYLKSTSHPSINKTLLIIGIKSYVNDYLKVSGFFPYSKQFIIHSYKQSSKQLTYTIIGIDYKLSSYYLTPNYYYFKHIKKQNGETNYYDQFIKETITQWLKKHSVRTILKARFINLMISSIDEIDQKKLYLIYSNCLFRYCRLKSLRKFSGCCAVVALIIDTNCHSRAIQLQYGKGKTITIDHEQTRIIKNSGEIKRTSIPKMKGENSLGTHQILHDNQQFLVILKLLRQN